MKTDAVILDLTDDQVRVFRGDDADDAGVPLPPAPPPEASSSGTDDGFAPLRQAWSQLSPPANRVLLLIPSHWCHVGPLSEQLTHESHEAQGYALEEQWPIGVEEIAFDVLRGSHHALGIGVEARRLTAWVQALDRLGCRVIGIAPKAILAVQDWASRDATSENSLIIWRHGHDHELFLLSNGKPVQWHWVRHDPSQVPARAQWLSLRHGPRTSCVMIDVEGTVADAWRATSLPGDLKPQQGDLHQAALRMATPILAGRGEPWVNLYQPPLPGARREHRLQRPLELTILGVLLMGLVLCGTLLWRSHRYHNDQLASLRQQQEIFHQLLPQQNLPISIRMRLESEVSALRTSTVASSLSPQSPATLQWVQRGLSALSSRRNLNLLELQFDARGLTMHGQSPTYQDVEDIAASLRQDPNLFVQPVQTTRTQSGAVDYVLSASGALTSPPQGSRPEVTP
ncbi:MAG: hypothetical protein IT440_10905 [Phycisphaeraceae bacterium]|nr:hypothetical protein [Phycisphaeraceae bacterium]